MLDLPAIIQRSLLLALLLPGISAADECYPSPDSDKANYLVAFGSMLYEDAREQKAGETKLEVPVWVEGYRRGWITRSKADTNSVTHLGVTLDKGDRFNGVLISLPASKLKSIDRMAKRECRVKLNRSHLKGMNDMNLPESGDIWVYQTPKKNVAPPAEDFPVLQSDVDVFLTGCIEQAEHFKLKEFAELCVSTTRHWSMHWNNDRRSPADQKIVETKNRQIDKLLEKMEGGFYEHIRAH